MRIHRFGFVLALLAVSMVTAPSRGQGDPVVFRVGFAVENVDPVAPQWPGGFGHADAPTSTIAPEDDHLQVRAMAIRRGATQVLFAIVDTQGWFSGNQQGEYGSRDARLHAAAAINAADPTLAELTDANIIVSSTHSHAAPTIMGIWGPTDAAYLKLVHDQTVKALVRAADPANQRDAYLYAGEADVSAANVSAVEQTDGYQGWRVEGRTPVLWARDPVSGATLGTYVNVPVHADVVNGADLGVLSADHIGFERRALDALLGGTSVVAMGTLGRLESIIQVRGFDHSKALASYVTNQVMRALASAVPVTDGTLGAAQQYLSVPSTNPALAGLNFGHPAADQLGHPEGDATGIWTIDRAILPPYVAGPNFGTWVNAFRIGDYVYATEPGEAFPEVSDAIRDTFPLPADHVRIVGMAQDQLGYYYPPETYPWTFVNPSDHHIYNASLLLGEANVKGHALNAVALGYTPDPAVHVTSQFDSPEAWMNPGVQFFPERAESANVAFRFDVRRSAAGMNDVVEGVTLGEGPSLGGFSGPITWDFGDGSAPVSTGEGFVSHTYASSGHYLVVASVTDPGDASLHRYSVYVVVDPPPSAVVNASGGTLSADVSGGSGAAVAAHWSFSDGSVAHGLTVTQPAGTTGTVTVVDSAGNTANASF